MTTQDDTIELEVPASAVVAHELRSRLAALIINLEFALGELERIQGIEHVRAALGDARIAGDRLSLAIARLEDLPRSEPATEGSAVARFRPSGKVLRWRKPTTP